MSPSSRHSDFRMAKATFEFKSFPGSIALSGGQEISQSCGISGQRGMPCRAFTASHAVLRTVFMLHSSWHANCIITPLQVSRQQSDPFSISKLSTSTDFMLDRGTGSTLQELAKGATKAKIITAFFGIEGYDKLAQSMNNATVDLLIGFSEGRKMFRESLDSSKDLFRDSLNAPQSANRSRTSTRMAGKRLREDLSTGSNRIRQMRVRQSKSKMHCKMYLFDRDRGIHGSPNLSQNGFFNNIENIQVFHSVSPSRAQQFLAVLNQMDPQSREDMESRIFSANRALHDAHLKFDKYFEEGLDCAEDYLEILNNSWIAHDSVDPLLLLIRCLQELNYFPHQEIVQGKTIKLAPFQEPIAHALLNVMMSHRRAILVAPVGIGKTVIGTWVCAQLQRQGIVKYHIISAPNEGIQEAWKNQFRDFGMMADGVTHYHYNTKGNRLRKLGETHHTDLLVLDEAHGLNNCGGVRHQKGKKLINEGSGMIGTSPDRMLVMQLTASPVSTKWNQADALVALMCPQLEGTIKSSDDFLNCPFVVQVGLPDIMQHYGENVEGSSDKALKFGEGDFRWFPRLTSQLLEYQDDKERLYSAIESLPLNYHMDRLTQTTMREFLGLEDDHDVPGGDVGMDYKIVKLGLMMQAESSPYQLAQALRNIEKRASAPEKSFVKPLETLEAVKALRRQVDCMDSASEKFLGNTESKWQALEQRMEASGVLDHVRENRTKILVFTSFLGTVQYVKEQFYRLLEPKHFPYAYDPDEDSGLIRTVTGNATKRVKREILSSWKSGRCRILIATDTLSEGLNLHSDNHDVVIVNYELFWTPLRLIQRIGRVDRPSKTQRSVTVYSCYPGERAVGSFEGKLKMLAKVDQRAKQIFKSFGTNARLFTGDSTGKNKDNSCYMRDLLEDAASAQSWLFRDHARPDFDTGTFLNRSSSPWLRDLLHLRDDQMEQAKRLPVGATSVLWGNYTSSDIIALCKDGSSGKTMAIQTRYNFSAGIVYNLQPINELRFLQTCQSRRAAAQTDVSSGACADIIDRAIDALHNKVSQECGGSEEIVILFAFVSFPLRLRNEVEAAGLGGGEGSVACLGSADASRGGNAGVPARFGGTTETSRRGAGNMLKTPRSRQVLKNERDGGARRHLRTHRSTLPAPAPRRGCEAELCRVPRAQYSASTGRWCWLTRRSAVAGRLPEDPEGTWNGEYHKVAGMTHFALHYASGC